MSTPSISSPRPLGLVDDVGAFARRLVRGREGDPWWSRPGLIAVAVLAAMLTRYGR
ncbi:MAG TPA: hypothetical protein VME22_08510 [Solirubrobacteraceae bacterium]|nr:hypothetical protein [Solirubrobacteraceae bacterium]